MPDSRTPHPPAVDGRSMFLNYAAVDPAMAPEAGGAELRGARLEIDTSNRCGIDDSRLCGEPVFQSVC